MGIFPDRQNCGFSQVTSRFLQQMVSNAELWCFDVFFGVRLDKHRLQRKQLASDPGMHHGTCVTHTWCMSGSLTHGGGEIVPGIPGACATRNFAYLVSGPLEQNRIPHSTIAMMKSSYGDTFILNITITWLKGIINLYWRMCIQLKTVFSVPCIHQPYFLFISGCSVSLLSPRLPDIGI